MPPRATAEQFALFNRYQKARHADGDMAAMGFYDYRAMVEDTPISSTASSRCATTPTGCSAPA